MSCILDDMEVSVIPEIDHYIGQCICFKCTCNRHRCPSSLRPSHVKKSYASSYRRSFKKHPKSSVHPRPEVVYKPNPHKMDLKTTNRSAYVPYEIKAKRSRQRSDIGKNVKFSGRSLYHRDYPSWGPLPVCHKKERYVPRHYTSFKFTHQSSYHDAFKGKTPDVGHRIKKNRAISNPLVAVALEQTFQTTSHRAFKHPKHTCSSVRLKTPSYEPTPYASVHFKSEAQRAYLPQKTNPKDHHFLRKTYK